MRVAMLWVIASLWLGCALDGRQGAMPAPPGQVPELDFFVGQWRARMEDPGTGKKLELRYSLQPGVGGRWYVGTGRIASEGLELQDLWGRDPVSGELVRSLFDSTGVFGTVRSKGWEGEKLVFEGEASSAQGRVAVRETIVRAGPDTFTAVWEALQDGEWKAYSVEQLERVR
jgi:hypothetical protein